MTPTMAESQVLRTLLQLREAALETERAGSDRLAGMPEDQRASAANLLHYLAFRAVDVRSEQRALARLGLSSLGRSEAHVLASLDAVIGRLAVDLGDVPLPLDLRSSPAAAIAGDVLLERHATDALGTAPDDVRTRLMVTLPTQAATDPGLVKRFVEAGMTLARINCAHDGPSEWRAMAVAVRAAAAEVGKEVRITCDLAGPKLRTGPIEPGPEVIRSRPQRDVLGRVEAPATVVFAAGSVSGSQNPPTIPIDGSVFEAALAGDELHLRDARGRHRVFEVEVVEAAGIRAGCERTTYFVPGLSVELRRSGERIGVGHVGQLPARAATIELSGRDLLEVRCTDAPGRPARQGPDGMLEPALIGLPVPQVFEALRVGHRVLFDDGALAGVVREVSGSSAIVEMTHAGTEKLRAEKGINLPDTPLRIPALARDDLEALEVVAPFADLIALSFVDDPADIARLHDELDRLGADDVGVILKIERRGAFEVLPELLLEAMRRPPVAVMVARGDLAVEVGFERLAELQEEILWLCGAAHVPVILATQVLESLAKAGSPTRAEVTDAAWAVRTECVMLNKGPYVPEAMVMLRDILARMQQHHEKRTPMLRSLSVARAAVGG